MSATYPFRYEGTQFSFGGLLKLYKGDLHSDISTFALRAESQTESPTTLLNWGSGILYRSTCQLGLFTVDHERFYPTQSPQKLATRICIKNTSPDPLLVDQLIPLQLEAEGLKLGTTPVSEWVLMRQPRHKNDMPATSKLGSHKAGKKDLVRGIPETGGIPNEKLGDANPIHFVSSELMVLFAEDASLILGVTPLDQCLISMELEVSLDFNQITTLSIICHGDGQQVESGSVLESPWVIVDGNPNPFGAIDELAETWLAMYPNTRILHRTHRNPSTVWCSWYYYGDGCTKAEVDSNLNVLEQNPLPIDVIQIDACWDEKWGDWYPNHRWQGLETYAKEILKRGYQPGIWTCPFLTDWRSYIRYHHWEWLLKDKDGNPILFPMGTDAYVLDPTHPEVQTYLETLFHRLTHEWGFTYHKLDFTRAVSHPNAVFYNRTRNRAQAYRMGIEAVRRGMGTNAYLNICGGLYGPIIDLVDAQRSGSDTTGSWNESPAWDSDEEGYGPFTIKQNTLRYWMNSLWENDPDAVMVRRRPEPYRNEILTIGTMNDIEAETSMLNQFLGGGIVCFSENLEEIDSDRLHLLRHCVPSLGHAAIPRDAFEGVRFPEVFHTKIKPMAAGLSPWHCVSLVNWYQTERTLARKIDTNLIGSEAQPGTRYAVYSFHQKTFWNLGYGDSLPEIAIPPHGCDIFKIQPLTDPNSAMVFTDGHFSMGGTEIRAWCAERRRPGNVVRRDCQR